MSCLTQGSKLTTACCKDVDEKTKAARQNRRGKERGGNTFLELF